MERITIYKERPPYFTPKTYFASVLGVKYPFPATELNETTYVDYYLKHGKVHGIEHAHQWTRFFKPGDTVLDLGAYIGTMSIALALQGGLVHAFEISPRNYDRLENICRPLRQIKVHKVGLADRTGEAVYYYDCCDGQPAPARVVAYDEYAAQEGIPDPAFVKMDLEGMESLALLGMGRLLEKVRPVWEIEYHEDLALCNFVSKEQGGFDFAAFRDMDYQLFGTDMEPAEGFATNGYSTLFFVIPQERLQK